MILYRKIITITYSLKIHQFLRGHNIYAHIVLKKHLDYKIHKMLVFLSFHSHLLCELHVKSLYVSKFQHNQHFTYHFLCGDLRLFLNRMFICFGSFFAILGRNSVFYDFNYILIILCRKISIIHK
jgi:hypothetical protein